MEALFAILIQIGLMKPPQVVSPVDIAPNVEFAPIVTHPKISFSELRSSLPIIAVGTISAVMPIATQSTQIASTPSALLSPTPSQSPKTSKKPKMTIALLGDSMIETLGSFSELTTLLKATYPNTEITILNYGVGSKNINDGLTRISKPFLQNGVQHESLVSGKPDVIIFETFGYNPYAFEEGALDTHWLAMAYIVDAIHQDLPEAKIAMLSTIAPNSQVFADGIPSMTLDPAQKQSKTRTIKRYLENGLKFAASQRIPIANAYHKSTDSTGDGKIEYISNTDHIHYSPKGKELVAQTLSETIVSNGLLE